MAGHVIFKYLKDQGKYHVTGITRSEKLDEDNIVLDVTDFKALEGVIALQRPDVIINVVGVLIGGSQKSPGNAILLNSYLPHFLSDACLRYGSKFIHISTDCVFSGSEGSYTESSFRDADDTYGRSKALGEVINDRDLTIRTSIIGPELKEKGEGLFDWFMKQSGAINGFSNAYWSGVTTLQLAKSINEILDSSLTALLHLSNNTKISKYDLLVLFKQIWNKKNIDIVRLDTYAKDKSLINNRSGEGRPIPGYEAMLNEMNLFMRESSYYAKYYN